MNESETHSQAQARLDQLHQRIQSKLDDLHHDFKELQNDLQTASLESRRARSDRIEGFKRALRNILEAADRADREWH